MQEDTTHEGAFEDLEMLSELEQLLILLSEAHLTEMEINSYIDQYRSHKQPS